MSYVYEQTPDIGILLPKIENWDKTHVRYGGLVAEIVSREVDVALLESHVSYVGGGVFAEARLPHDASLGFMRSIPSEKPTVPLLVRDLTMPKSQDMPLYNDPAAPRLVHPPAVNEFFRSKSNVYDLMPHLQPFTVPRVDAIDVHEAVAEIPSERVVIKPDTGSASEGVLIGNKNEVLDQFRDANQNGVFVVQEAIDMTLGLPEHNVQGAHNLRFIVIGGAAIFGFIRDDGGQSLTLAGEGNVFSNRTFGLPEDYSKGFRDVLEGAQESLLNISGTNNTVIAIDLMRGIGHEGEMQEYVLEINRRPLRNSPLDGNDAGTLWASGQWDKAEAEMLVDIVKGKK